MKKNKAGIVLFFSRGTSLEVWSKTGLFDREVEPYKEHFKNLFDISFLTYGKDEEVKFIKELSPINVMNNRFGLPVNLFSLISPILFRKQLKNADIYKSNQINGWWMGGISKLFYQKPLIVRCGYLLSMNQEQKWKNYSQLRIKLVSLLERAAFKYSDAIIVTTPQMKDEVIQRHKILPRKITIIPNAVNISIFKPMTDIQKIERKIGFVGRFTGQKRINLLISAVSKIKNASIMLIGKGPLRKEIESQAKHLGVKADFLGNVPNYELPGLLNSCQTFVLLSEWEGMPKALLEAMACALPVIGTDAPGIRDVIKNDYTGIICKDDPNDIQKAIERIINDTSYAKKLGVNARQYIIDNYSLKAATEKEIKLLKNIIQE